jgi:hypothetical protein
MSQAYEYIGKLIDEEPDNIAMSAVVYMLKDGTSGWSGPDDGARLIGLVITKALMESVGMGVTIVPVAVNHKCDDPDCPIHGKGKNDDPLAGFIPDESN